MIERISQSWPNDPDLSGLDPDYAAVVMDRRLPYSADDPLIFHVLTTIDADYELLDIMRQGGSLLPRSWADERWGDQKSMIFARDATAGDDDYLFTTPGNVFSTHHERASRPAVAFHLSYILKQAKQLGFRVHDLEGHYKQVEERLAGEPYMFDDFEYDFDTAMDAQEDRYEAMVAESVREQLEAVADCGTQYGFDAAAQLTRLYNELLGAFRDRGTSMVSADDPEAMAIYRDALPLFPECILDYMDGQNDWVDELMVEREVADLAENWKALFREGSRPFPYRLLFGTPRPELLVQGQLALCEAAFFRDDEGAWLPVPYEICVQGREWYPERRTDPRRRRTA